MKVDPRDIGRRVWALLAFLGFSVMVTIDQAQALTGLIVATIGLILVISRRPLNYSWLPRLIAGGIPILFGLLWLAGDLTPYGTEPGWLHWLGGVIWCVAGLPVLLRGDRITRTEAMVLVLTAGVMSLGLGIVVYVTSLDFGIDVTFLHVSAADALLSGSSPYGDAVTVFDGSPDAPPGTQIVGYPYPPATLFPFAAGTLLADPRLISLACWLLLLVVVGFATLRTSTPLIPLGAFLGLAALPGWPLVLVSSWTEPLSIAILAITLATWNRKVLSSLMLGFALATKQYFVALAPLFLGWHVDSRLRRLTLTAIGATALLSPVFFWDNLDDTFRSLVTFLLQASPRVDGSSLVGIGSFFGLRLNPPLWLTVLAPLAVAAGLGPFIRRRTDLAVAMSAALGVAFLLGSQAFANYWLLPASLMALAASLDPEPGQRLLGRRSGGTFEDTTLIRHDQQQRR